MGKVKIVEAGATPWLAVRDVVDPAVAEKMSQAERDGQVRIFHAGTEHSPQLFEARLEPNLEVEVHAHEENEIIYVLEGKLLIGKKSLGPGASIFVEGGTLYGFRSGPNGLHFLNFRPRTDEGFVTRDEFLARDARAKTGG